MHGFGSHTYSLYNDKNQRVWVKFHLKTQQGIRNLTDEEAEALIAKDRESSQTDLFNAIERGDFPRWTMCLQIMTEEQAAKHKDNPFDLTKVWSQKEYPLIEVGVLELNRNPENYFADVEQAAFNPANIVPGIGFSPDKMLQGRLFSYGDAQRYRLGVNHHLIPVNKPKIPVNSYHRDGLMRVDGNFGATIGYDPNSYGEWAQQDSFREPPLPLEGAAGHHDPYRDDDCFYQAGDLYRLMTEDKRKLLLENTARNIAPVSENIKYRHAAHCYLADKEYGERLAGLLNLDRAKVVELAGMDREKRLLATRSA
jgi:catalase